MIIETKLVLVAVVAAVGGALMQATTASNVDPMTVLVSLGALGISIVGAIATYFGLRVTAREKRDSDAAAAAREEATAKRETEKEARENERFKEQREFERQRLLEQRAFEKEQRDAAAAVLAETKGIGHAVNGNHKAQLEVSEKQSKEIQRLNDLLLKRADAAPSTETSPAPIAAAQPSLLVPTPSPVLGTGAVQVSVPVHLVDQSKPVDVKVIEEDTPNTPKKGK